MTTKKCEKCGWVLAIQDPLTHCPICKTKFKTGLCSVCKQPVEYYRPDRCVCRVCYDTVTRKPNANKNLYQRRKDVYSEWLAKVRSVPKEHPLLTEAQWLEAVKHFNGCALCKNESVDTRSYFIPFNRGGRYCDWNILPICETCAIEVRRNKNYFLRRRPEGLVDIIKYLEEKLNAAVGKTTDKEQ